MLRFDLVFYLFRTKKVAWIHIDRQMILTIHRHVISKIPRYSITYDNANTWQLHVNQAQQDDRGKPKRSHTLLDLNKINYCSAHIIIAFDLCIYLFIQL